MSNMVRKVAYFALEVPNRAGEAARVLGILAEAGVNLLAFSGFPKGRKAQLDIIPEDVETFKKTAKIVKLKVRPQKFGFLIQGDDQTGALVKLLETLAEKKINITAIDAVAAGEDRFAAIFWVLPRDVNKAMKVLGTI